MRIQDLVKREIVRALVHREYTAVLSTFIYSFFSSPFLLKVEIKFIKTRIASTVKSFQVLNYCGDTRLKGFLRKFKLWKENYFWSTNCIRRGRKLFLCAVLQLIGCSPFQTEYTDRLVPICTLIKTSRHHAQFLPEWQFTLELDVSLFHHFREQPSFWVSPN